MTGLHTPISRLDTCTNDDSLLQQTICSAASRTAAVSKVIVMPMPVGIEWKLCPLASITA